MNAQIKLSVVLAAYNEEANLEATLRSVEDLADEIIVVDGSSTDRTVEIAKKFGAIVKIVPNQKIFHINKQIATEMAKGEWILELDADEIITPELAREIKTVLDGTQSEIDINQNRLFRRHMDFIAVRDDVTYTQREPINGYFIARKNYFLGNYLMHSGVYPDGVIRLVRNGSAFWPCKSVHEQMSVTGGVSWLTEPMIHMADPTFARYLQRANRYTSLTAQEYKRDKVGTGILDHLNYLFIKPCTTFLLLFIRHKGFLDGFSGLVWALMSGLHFPIAYMKYKEMRNS